MSEFLTFISTRERERKYTANVQYSVQYTLLLFIYCWQCLRHVIYQSNFTDLCILHEFVMLTQYCAGDKIEKNEMGWACGAYG